MGPTGRLTPRQEDEDEEEIFVAWNAHGLICSHRQSLLKLSSSDY